MSIRKTRLLRFGMLAALLGLVIWVGRVPPNQQRAGNNSSPVVPHVAAPFGGHGSGGPQQSSRAPANTGQSLRVGQATKNDVSPPLRSINPIAPKPWTKVRELPEPREGQAATRPQARGQDPVVQRTFGALTMPAPIRNFNGLPNVDGVYPPDTNGDVGPNHIVQWVNTSFQIYDKSGTSLYGPAEGNTIWTGFGDPCETHNEGDPVVLYDQYANRWLMSQLTASGPFGECVAISTTGDPTGSYYRYWFWLSDDVLYDYPKLSVWPDGYYLTANRFFWLLLFEGPSAIVMQRDRMINGQTGPLFLEYALDTTYDSLLPADPDGATLPPAGAPNYMANIGASALNLFKFHVDWATPGNSTFTGPSSMSVAPYTQLCANNQSCIPQPGTSVGIDAIGDRLMYRLAYRNFGDHESLVTNHTVDVGGGQAGVRWYEVRSPSSTPVLYQQGTYAPDSTNRWMASAAMDYNGDMAIGYSVASTSTFPGIRYTGRVVTDTLGTLPQGEVSLIEGAGSQTGTGSRWGDYSRMAVDPTDDCTFWYTSEYMPTTGDSPWQTRIGSFRFPSCIGTGGPTATPLATSTPTVTPTTTRTSTPTTTPTPYRVLVGHVTWQGRPAQPNALQAIGITLTLRLGGSPATEYISKTTDMSGFFTVPVGTLPSGIYNWRTKDPIYLANSGTVTLQGALMTSTEMGLMKAGDCDNNNVVNTTDFTIMKNTFGKGFGDPTYDPRADFNGDDVVNASDFTLLRANFGVGGAPPIRP